MTDDNRKARLKRWIDDYGKYVLGTSLRILKNKQDAEDVFQNTFIKAYVKVTPFKSEKHIKPWLIRVASNECISILRSGWKKKVDLMDIPYETYEICPTECEKSEIIHSINKLPKIYRRAIYLSCFAGYSSDEIASIEKVSPSAVRSRLERARAKLKYELERNN